MYMYNCILTCLKFETKFSILGGSLKYIKNQGHQIILLDYLYLSDYL